MYSWIACELRTGRVICDLPDLTVDKVGVTLCDTYNATGSLPVPQSPAPPLDWDRAIMEMGSCLVLLDGDTPIWGGIITQAPRTEASTVQIALPSWEAYLARRYIPDFSRTATEQCALAAQLVAASLDATVPLIVEYTAGSTLRDRTYTSSQDKTLLVALQELSAVIGGPEWTIGWRHLTSPERYVPVLTIADRIGVAAPAGLGPAATFEMPGPVSTFKRSRDWSLGAGANSVVATSTSSDGADRPQSTPQIYSDPDRPTVEYRWSPSSSITQQATLDAHAAAALAVLKGGSVSLGLTAAVDDAPRLGVDWSIGDDVGYHIAAPSVGVIDGTARAVAWEATLTGVRTITPILATAGVS